MPTTREVYGDHEDQVAELTLPDGADAGPPLPVAVLVHGGFWAREYADLDRMRGAAADLAARGWAAYNVEYRRLGGGGGWPQSAEDVSGAIDHLLAVRDRGVPIDLGRVVTVGHSAGGHLGLLDAAREPREAGVRVAAVGALAPLTDVLVAHGSGADGARITEAFLGGSPADRAEVYARASPTHRVPLGVPQLVVHGDLDDVVPRAMIETYVDAARSAGDDVVLDARPENGHFDLIEPATEAWASVVVWLQRVV